MPAPPSEEYSYDSLIGEMDTWPADEEPYFKDLKEIIEKYQTYDITKQRLLTVLEVSEYMLGLHPDDKKYHDWVVKMIDVLTKDGMNMDGGRRKTRRRRNRRRLTLKHKHKHNKKSRGRRG